MRASVRSLGVSAVEYRSPLHQSLPLMSAGRCGGYSSQETLRWEVALPLAAAAPHALEAPQLAPESGALATRHVATNQPGKIKVELMISILQAPYLRAQPTAEFARKVFNVDREIASSPGGKRVEKSEREENKIKFMPACHSALRGPPI